jgi:hypothetical protein
MTLSARLLAQGSLFQSPSTNILHPICHLPADLHTPPYYISLPSWGGCAWIAARSSSPRTSGMPRLLATIKLTAQVFHLFSQVSSAAIPQPQSQKVVGHRITFHPMTFQAVNLAGLDCLLTV